MQRESVPNSYPWDLAWKNHSHSNNLNTVFNTNTVFYTVYHESSNGNKLEPLLYINSTWIWHGEEE
jgi:hypothetical protein